MARPASVDDVRAALRQVTSAVAVITSGDTEERNGLTATAFCSVTFDPPTVLICVNKSASADVVMKKTGCFAVNILTDAQEDVARRFSTPKLDASKRFSDGEWQTLATGAPVLADSAATFDYRIVDRHSYASHDVIIGNVVAVRSRCADNLLYHDGAYRRKFELC
jgi:flavin reductase (DIM6/NTAB) family NADH-FMN oxidoreductase RutF